MAMHSSTGDMSQWFDEESHPNLVHRFSRQQREAMLRDDLAAGRGVTTVLVAIVTVGMAGMAGIVTWLAVAF